MNEILWAEINLNAIKSNIAAVKQKLNQKTKIMAVVKANAYGHGDIEVAKFVLKNGVDYLAVARINEAIKLRQAGILAPILIFSHSPINFCQDLIKYSLIQSVYSLDYAKELAKNLSKSQILIHLKIDTGMGRLGFLADCFRKDKNLIKEIQEINKLKSLKIEGIYSHFACSDEKDKSYTKKQFQTFLNILNDLQKAKINIPLKHIANSGAAIEMPETALDMIRFGISLYGLYPSNEVRPKAISLKPAMSIKAKIIQIKKVQKGFCVSYGKTFKTKKESILATIPIGYADGYSRILNDFYVLINGKKAKIVGRICMDSFVVDISHIENTKVGDIATILGKDKNLSISADDIAKKLKTINYEVVSKIMERVPRIYINSKFKIQN